LSPPSNTDALAHELIDLAHDADRVAGEGRIVDAYTGTYAPRTADRPPALSQLRDALADLAAKAATATDRPEAQRLHDIQYTARGLSTFLAMEEDENALPYREAVESILGTPLFMPTEAELHDLRDELSDCLASLGLGATWPSNLTAWQSQGSVTAQEYLRELERRAGSYKDELLSNVLRHVVTEDQGLEMLHASSVSYGFADANESWSAYHYYRGNSHSVIELNRARSFNRDNAAIFASHEVYPGHHTQALIREHLYRRGELGVEATLSTLNSPGNVLAEGIGDYAQLLIGQTLEEGVRAAYLADQLATQWRHRLGVALHEGLISEREAVEDLAVQAGLDRDAAGRALRFGREWKYYFPSYVMGLRRVEELVRVHGKAILRDAYTREHLGDPIAA
jgi:hypothetical protein